MLGKHHSDEAKEKISKANSGKTGPMLGKHHTEETKEKLREINLDKKHSAETKEKLSKIFHTSGEECSYSKLTWEEVNKIREKYLTGNYSQAELAVEYSVSRATIKKIVNCESWKGNKKNESRNS
jgi:DNA-binding transcriptional regulator YiaG